MINLVSGKIDIIIVIDLLVLDVNNRLSSVKAIFNASGKGEWVAEGAGLTAKMVAADFCDYFWVITNASQVVVKRNVIEFTSESKGCLVGDYCLCLTRATIVGVLVFLPMRQKLAPIGWALIWISLNNGSSTEFIIFSCRVKRTQALMCCIITWNMAWWRAKSWLNF